MPQRSFTQCKKMGCPNLVRGYGYCPEHTTELKIDYRESFKGLDDKKTPEQKKFYSSSLWTRTSIRHRRAEPLCRRCHDSGRIVCADMVHHNPPLEVLISENKNPLDDNYLESLCNDCHLSELRNKRGK